MGIEELRRLSISDRNNSYRAAKREQQAIVRKLADSAYMLAPGDTASYWPEMLVQGNRRWLEDDTTPKHIESVLHKLGANITCRVLSLDRDSASGKNQTDTRPVVLISRPDFTVSSADIAS